MFKKQIKLEYQFFFEFVNKVVLPRAECRSIAALVDISIMEALSSFQPLNLVALMIEHMSMISGLIEAQQCGTEEIDRLIVLLAQKEAQMALLRDEWSGGEPGAMLELQK
ncbi:hypothetical protein HAX54_007268 [Datura stramonium]|uniref:Uncharacterized protein n=1 Tax=Datura stramonium TaxID=4076 RepID=A0ABS8TCR6_DATST|nr:hypothetical protein [Datura stramonium]